MKPVITRDGIIENTDDAQPGFLPLTDFSVPNPDVALSDAGDGPNFAAASAADVLDPVVVWDGGNFGGADFSLFFPPVLFVNTVTYAPLVITPIFGASILDLVGSVLDPTTPLQIENAVDAAINYFETNWTSSVPIGITNAVSITIQFDYGLARGTPITEGAAHSAYDFTAIGNGGFGSAYALLSGILPNLPIVDPSNGGLILETIAQSQILGTAAGPVIGPSGWVGLNTVANGVTFAFDPANQSVPGQVGAVGAIEHELSEVFGRVADLSTVPRAGNSESVLDLYRFSKANTFATVPGQADYFSLNQGTTSLGLFNDAANGGDAGDWATSMPPDRFDAFLSPGAGGTISNVDTMALVAVGLQEKPRTLLWTGAQGSGFATAADWNDLTSGQTPGRTEPGAADTAEFLTGGGTITGSGTASAVQFGGLPQWNVTGGAGLNALTGVTVGQGGVGSVLINGGASVNGLGVSDTISGATGSVASVTVDGIGSAWNSAKQLTLGETGIGHLTASNGAAVTAGTLNIGSASGSGVLTVGAGAVVNAKAVNLSNGQVIMQGGLLDPVVVNIAPSGGILGTGIVGGDIVIDNGTILANGSSPGNSLLVVPGTILGGGTLNISGGTTADGTTINSPGLLQLSNVGTLELKGPVLNAASTTFTDEQTPTGTYTVTNSVIDVAFSGANEVLILDDIAGFAGTVTTYHAGDSFVITGGTLSNLGVSNGNTLTVGDSGTGTPVTDRIIFGSPINAAAMVIQNGNTIAVSPTIVVGTTLEIANGPYALTNFNAPGTPQFTTLRIDAGVAVTTDASDVLAGVTLINNGTINLSGFVATAALQNDGSITGDVTLASGVVLTNTAGGTISGSGLAAIQALGPASVANAGLIDPAAYGVDLTAGGAVINAAGGTIEGTVAGVLISGGDGTVTNGGTIIGGGVDAVSLAAGFSNRVILGSGAVFTGLVDGGNTIGAGATSTLELTGAGGVLFGFGAEYVNFARVEVDPNALWKFGATNNLAAGTTLTDQGQLLVLKGAVATGGAVTIAAVAGIAASGTVSAGNWSGMSRLVAGGSGDGSLLISNGGSATSAGVEVAANAGATGDIFVTGSQSLLSSTGSIMVGDAGLGSLSINASALVTAGGDATIANTGSASGSSINVTGAGSRLSVTGELIVGGGGFGQLSISQSATVSAGSADAAATAGGDGAISITGTGSALNVSGLLTVGDQSSGSLNIVNGASVTVGGLVIGTGASGSGNVVIGPGSHLTLTGTTINVGLAGSGVLNVQGGTLALVAGTTLTPGTFGRIVQVGGLIDPATVFDASGGSFGGGGTAEASGTIVNSSLATVSGGAETLLAPLITSSDSLNVAGVWSIKSGGTLVLDVNTFDNSQTIQFADLTGVLTIGQQVTLDATQTPQPIAASALSGFAAPIVGYKAGDKITFNGLNIASDSVSGNVVTLFDSGKNPLGTLTFQTGKGGADNAGAAAAKAQIVPCFAAGTRIATASGLMAVELLAVGDLVKLADGGHAPIVWVGQRAVNCRAHPRPETVWPVRVQAGAFGENVPVRDLYLSPDHAVFVNDVLVPVKLLINGASITQVARNRVNYFHVELPEHAVILAEGLTVESYLDIGDRANFRGDSDVIRLHPDFTARFAPETALLWESRSAAALVMAGSALHAARRTVMARRYLPVLRPSPADDVQPERVTA